MINDVYGYECKSHISKFKPLDRQIVVHEIRPDYYEFETIAVMLKHEQRHHNRDMVNFKKYADEGKSLEDTLKDFCENYDISYVDIRLFKRWLNSLGWRQDDTK